MVNANPLMRLLTGKTFYYDPVPRLIQAIRFGRGEACIAIVIKPLEAALEDGDHIYGSVRILPFVC